MEITLYGETEKLPKTCILSVFDHITHKNAEIHGKNEHVKKKDIMRNVCYECF